MISCLRLDQSVDVYYAIFADFQEASKQLTDFEDNNWFKLYDSFNYIVATVKDIEKVG